VASSDENVQNIPRTLRTCCGHPDQDVVSLDFSSAELVVAAVITTCRLLLSWFREGRDPHKEAAARIFHKPVLDVTDGERAVGKVANFNLLYGGGAGTIIRKAAERGVTLSWDDAGTIVSEFFEMFPEIRAWQQDQASAMRRGEPIRSPLGRMWPIAADNWHQINAGLNAPIQATASDLTLLGLDRAWSLIGAQGQVINIVHDSVDVLIPKGTFDEAAWREIAQAIAGVDARFPMQIEVAVGPTWGSTKKRCVVGGRDG
jgi:DNA polymerase-1